MEGSSTSTSLSGSNPKDQQPQQSLAMPVIEPLLVVSSSDGSESGGQRRVSSENQQQEQHTPTGTTAGLSPQNDSNLSYTPPPSLTVDVGILGAASSATDSLGVHGGGGGVPALSTPNSLLLSTSEAGTKAPPTPSGGCTPMYRSPTGNAVVDRTVFATQVVNDGTASKLSTNDGGPDMLSIGGRGAVEQLGSSSSRSAVPSQTASSTNTKAGGVGGPHAPLSTTASLNSTMRRSSSSSQQQHVLEGGDTNNSSSCVTMDTSATGHPHHEGTLSEFEIPDHQQTPQRSPSLPPGQPPANFVQYLEQHLPAPRQQGGGGDDDNYGVDPNDNDAPMLTTPHDDQVISGGAQQTEGGSRGGAAMVQEHHPNAIPSPSEDSHIGHPHGRVVGFAVSRPPRHNSSIPNSPYRHASDRAATDRLQELLDQLPPPAMGGGNGGGGEDMWESEFNNTSFMGSGATVDPNGSAALDIGLSGETPPSATLTYQQQQQVSLLHRSPRIIAGFQNSVSARGGGGGGGGGRDAREASFSLESPRHLYHQPRRTRSQVNNTTGGGDASVSMDVYPSAGGLRRRGSWSVDNSVSMDPQQHLISSPSRATSNVNHHTHNNNNNSSVHRSVSPSTSVIGGREGGGGGDVSWQKYLITPDDEGMALESVREHHLMQLQLEHASRVQNESSTTVDHPPGGDQQSGAESPAPPPPPPGLDDLMNSLYRQQYAPFGMPSEYGSVDGGSEWSYTDGEYDSNDDDEDDDEEWDVREAQNGHEMDANNNNNNNHHFEDVRSDDSATRRTSGSSGGGTVGTPTLVVRRTPSGLVLPTGTSRHGASPAANGLVATEDLAASVESEHINNAENAGALVQSTSGNNNNVAVVKDGEQPSGSGMKKRQRKKKKRPLKTADEPHEELNENGEIVVVTTTMKKNKQSQHYKPRKNIFILPTEVLRIVFDRYLAIFCLNPLRLVCKRFSQILQANCVLWHRRLPIMFENDEVALPIRTCKVHTSVAAVQIGAAPLSSLVNAFCFNGCCYKAWSQNAVVNRQRRKMEVLQEEELNYAFAVSQSLFFPAEGTSRAGTILMILTFALFIAFCVIFYGGYFSPTIAFAPLWVFFLLCYAVLYQFFCASPIEPIVLAIIVTIGFNLSTLLMFFYRVEGAHMSWLQCFTPALLCVACCATYAFLLWHRFAQNNSHSKMVVSLAGLATLTPILMLVFLILFGSELDGSIVIPSSARTVDPGEHREISGCESIVEGTVRMSGMPLFFFFLIILVNISYSLRTIGINELLVEESLACFTILGFGATGVGGIIMSLMILANANGCQLFTILLATASLFFTSGVLSISISKDHATHYKYLLFPASEAS